MKTIFNLARAVMVGGAVATGTQTTPAERRGEPITCLKGFDPVALTQGSKLPGDSGISVVRGWYRYLFASAENKGTIR